MTCYSTGTSAAAHAPPAPMPICSPIVIRSVLMRLISGSFRMEFHETPFCSRSGICDGRSIGWIDREIDGRKKEREDEKDETKK